jgi:hypothetical protein
MRSGSANVPQNAIDKELCLRITRPTTVLTPSIHPTAAGRKAEWSAGSLRAAPFVLPHPPSV